MGKRIQDRASIPGLWCQKGPSSISEKMGIKHTAYLTRLVMIWRQRKAGISTFEGLGQKEGKRRNLFKSHTGAGLWKKQATLIRPSLMAMNSFKWIRRS